MIFRQSLFSFKEALKFAFFRFRASNTVPMSAQEAQQIHVMCLRACQHVFSHEFAAAFFQDGPLFHFQSFKSIVPRMSYDARLVCFIGIVRRYSLQTVGCLCDLCKAARLLNASLTWSWTWDPLGTKHGNYYSCDWCLLRPESNKRFALAGSIWPERLRTRQG